MKTEHEVDCTSSSHPRQRQPSEGETVRRVTSQVLLGRQRYLHIEHGGERYVLRVTRQGKLILTK